MEISKEINNIFKKKKNSIFIKDTIKNKNHTYSDFFNKSNSITNFLKSKKIKEGSKILIKFDNSYEYLCLVFACLLGNFVACPIDTEIKKNKYNELEKILKPAIKITNAKQVKYIKKNYKNSIKDNSQFLIIFTSGTTGKPKGIAISNSAYINSARSFSKLIGYNENTKILHILPMYYNAGLLNTFFSALLSGSMIILSEKISAYNIVNFWKNFEKEEINSFHLTPEIANTLTKLSIGKDLIERIINLQIVSTGSYLHPNIIDKFEKIYKKRLLSCYGLTELGGPLTIQNWENTYIEGSVGYHSKEIKIKILKKSSDKQILIKSPYLMSFFINEKGKKLKPKLINGYFNTGDIGEYKKKELFIFGRRKDIVKKGAEIVSIPNIENIFLKSKLIEEVSGLSDFDEIRGSKIYLFVKFKDHNNLYSAIDKLKKEISKSLKRIELPDRIIPVPSLPKTYNGKVKKEILRDIYL
jgi:acyl-CoA synthetase (AMP-forming)/AMP-acid ligase II